MALIFVLVALFTTNVFQESERKPVVDLDELFSDFDEAHGMRCEILFDEIQLPPSGLIHGCGKVKFFSWGLVRCLIGGRRQCH